MPETKKLQAKVAVITGGTTGIGLATAKLFVKEGRTDTLRAMVGNPCVFIVAEAIELSDSAQSSNDVGGPERLRRRDREDAIASRRNHRLIDIAAGDHGRYSRLVPPGLEPGIFATMRAD